MDTNDKDNGQGIWPDDDKVIYIPDAEYHAFMQSLRKMEMVQKELHKIRDSMKLKENESDDLQ
ncbi:MAG: hypothetical protein LBP83_08265 [Dysgonamonadaceae bacterium]|jgi:hypothetical protein|nr:hypothetical protein [Dysgonamonadaceae bacterium]